MLYLPRRLPPLPPRMRSFFSSSVLRAGGSRPQLHSPSVFWKSRGCTEPAFLAFVLPGLRSLQCADLQFGSLKLSLGVGLNFQGMFSGSGSGICPGIEMRGVVWGS